MLVPENLQELVEDGIVESILRPLKSGKEAAVFLVVADGRPCAAKVYKAAEARNFRKRADYVEGRKVGDSRLLLRDVANVTRFFARFAPQLRRTDYGQEMWLLYESSVLDPDTPLTGRFKQARKTVDAEIVLHEIEAAKREAAQRAEARERGRERASARRR